MKIKQLLFIAFVTVLTHECSSSGKIPVVISKEIKDTLSQKIQDTVAINSIHEIDHSKTDTFLVNILREYPQFFDSILKYRKAWNVQIIYTEINRDKTNNPHFTDHYFNVDPGKSFYPASSVKLLVVLLALQKLTELSNRGLPKKPDMITEQGYGG